MQHQQENRDKAYKTVSCSVSETYRLMLSMEKFWRTFQEYTEGKQSDMEVYALQFSMYVNL